MNRLHKYLSEERSALLHRKMLNKSPTSLPSRLVSTVLHTSLAKQANIEKVHWNVE